jgi:chromosome segregation ATPase
MQERLDFFRSEKIKFEKRNLEVEKNLSEKNEEIKKITENLEKNKEEFSKLNSKHNGLLLYASDLQKKIEIIDIELLEKKQEINKFSSSDWGKLLTEKDQVIKILQNDIAFYRNEVNKIKNFLGVNKKMIPIDLAKRFDHLIDSYIAENKKYKRIVNYNYYYN